MAYIFLTVFGVLAVLFVSPQWPGRKALPFILSFIVAGGTIYSISEVFFLSESEIISKGEGSIEGIPWLEIALYFVMLAGMMSKYFFDAIGDGNIINFQKWQFIKPIFISPIVFGVLYSATDQSTSVVLLIIFAFQNGFFWQTVLNKT